MKWPCRTVAAASVLLGLASPSFAGQVKLEIRDGLVTLDAKDATIREIFAEWARVGQTRVVGADRVPGGPMTLQLTNIPERKALDILLRSVAGFVAAPRAVAQSTASVYDRIMLMPAARPAAAPAAAGPNPSPMASQPQIQRERNVVAPSVVVDDQDDDLPTAQMPPPGQPTGAVQPGMMTPNPQMPYNGAGAASPNSPAMNPQGRPNSNPYGLQSGNPNNPNMPSPGTTQQAVPTPQSAARPGMPTAPPPAQVVKPPEPIIK
jgi:hypothetical protein